MADPRTFVLIGNFEDNITPALTKINDSINGFKRNMASMATKRGGGYGDVTKSIGKLISAHKNLTSSLKETQEQLKSTEGNLRSYRLEMAKAARAARMFEKSGLGMGSKQFANNMDAANRSAQAYLRTLEQIYAQSRRTPRGGYGGGGFQPPRPPGGGYGGGGGGGMRPPTSSNRGSGSAGGGMSAHMAEFGFAFTLGNAIAQPIQNAVVSGFQIGVGLMMKPFEYFANNLKERIEDEQSDIKAAGGIFSIARRQKDPFVKTMDEAMEFTQANNKHMAELADALPGNTQQYIEVSKRISDSISRIVMSDPSKAIERANQLREEEGKQELTGSSQAQTKGAITQLLGEMTKKTVLAGLGTGGGPGGVAGAYGLPQLTERMLTQDQVSMGQFQRYAAIFKDPLIMEALNRFIPKINASAAGTMERFEVMEKFYDEVLPKEMIRKFERSTAGILELFNTTIFGPETGLFGLGRKMEGMGKMMDDYGNYIKVYEDGTREVVNSLDEASAANLSLFDMLRDSFANLGISLYPILQNLGAIFDPLNKVSKLLVDFRHLSGRFLNSFEAYKNGFEDMVKAMGKDEKKEFLKIGLELRASLAAVNNFFLQKGIIGQGQFQETAKQLMSTSFDYKAMISGMVDTFLNSNAAGELGTLIGEIIGTVLTEVAKVTGFISGRIESSNKLFDGIKKGFNDAGGPEAIKNIFSDLFKSLFKLLIEVMKVIPAEGYLLMGAMTIIPAIVQFIGMSIAEKTLKGLEGLRGKLGELLTKMFARVQAQVPKNLDVVPVNVRDLSQEAASRITDPSRMLPPAKEAALATTTKAGPLAKGMNAFSKFFMSFGNYIKGVGPRFMGFFKGFLGKLSIFGAAITSVISLFQGKDLATALAEGAGPLLGAALGAALIPFLGPIGPMIGSAIGGWIGSMKPVVNALRGVFAGLIWGFNQLKTSLGPAVEAVSGVFSTLFNIVKGIIPGLDSFGAGLSTMDFLFIAVKLALFPFISALNGAVAAVLLLKIALLEFDKWINNTFQWGDRQGRIQDEIEKTWAQMGKVAEIQEKMNADLLKKLPKTDQDRKVGTKAVLGGREVTWNGKEWKPATTVAPSKPPAPPKPNAKPRDINAAITALGGDPKAPLKVPTIKPTAAKPTGSDPVQANLRAKALQDIQWFWKKLTTAPEPPKKPPKKPPVGERIDKDIARLITAKPAKEVTETAQNTNNLNKRATDQIKETANVKSGVDKTTQAVNSMAAKITPQTSLQTTTAAIYNLLASGQLRVQGALGNSGNKNNGLGDLPFTKSQTDPNQMNEIFEKGKWTAYGSPGKDASNLIAAAAYENKHKPAGSKLGVFNTSETVIPAAGGYGMKDFMDILSSGFSAVNNQYKSLATGVNTLSQETATKFQQTETTNADRYQKTTTTLNNYHKENQQEFSKIGENILQLSQKVATMSSMGGMFGGGGGMELGAGYGSKGSAIAGELGRYIKATGGAPGSIWEHPEHGGVKGKHAPGSYHYSGRAIDIGAWANEQAGVIARIQQFNAKYGVKPVEFLHAGNDPAGHSDHVHVAYATGYPTFGFQSQREAIAWERKATMGNVSVASITARQGEFGGGGSVTVNAPITITQQPGQSMEQLAYEVAYQIGKAVNNVVDGSILT